MEKVVLKATKRELVGKKVGALRRQGKLPAVLYGPHLATTAIMLDAHEGAQTLAQLTSSSLVTVNLDGKEYLTIVREKQRDFLKNRLVHLDFQVVSLTEKMRAKVGIVLTGTAPAVKDFNAVIHGVLTEVEVESMPQDLPERLTVDISALAEIGDSLRVRDLTLPPKVEILSDPDETIAVATAPKKAEVIEAVPAEAEAAAAGTEPGAKEVPEESKE
jgi:large subunit ribosomal protein L25